MTREQMINLYATMAAAHKYLVGYVLGGYLYYVMFDGMIPDELLKLDRASSKRGGYAKIRVRLDTKAKLMLKNRAICLGKAEMMDYDDNYNKGEHFERLITERLTGSTWNKDSRPFWEAGDIELNGEQVQVKLDNAELTNERTLTKRLAS